MSGFFWRQDFAGAEQVLQDALRDHPSLFSDICPTISQDAVSISGWDELCAEIDDLARRGTRCTAIEIDLSGHAKRGSEPGFECNYYDDSIYRFSTASHEEILAQCENGIVEWQGGFVEIDHALTCHGLAPLYPSLAGYQHRGWGPPFVDHRGVAMDVPHDFVAFKLGQWFLYLRVHTALWRDLQSRGLPYRMPVVVGTHNFGPSLYSVYMPETICDSRDASDRILAQREADVQAWYDQHMEDEVRGFRERRDGIHGWPFFRNRRARKALIDWSAAYEKVLLSQGNLSVDRPTWKMSNEAFETFIERYRASQDRSRVLSDTPR